MCMYNREETSKCRGFFSIVSSIGSVHYEKFCGLWKTRRAGAVSR